MSKSVNVKKTVKKTTVKMTIIVYLVSSGPLGQLTLRISRLTSLKNLNTFCPPNRTTPISFPDVTYVRYMTYNTFLFPNECYRY